MSAQNPFQIPDCFKLDIEVRRRERFKKTVVTAVIVSAALVVGLLIEGCVNEKSQAKITPAISTQAAAPADIEVSAQGTTQQVQPAISESVPPVQPCPVATVQKPASPVASPQTTGGAVYLVKSGDTLSHIAKTYKVSVTALKSANSLDTDRISVGEKLKIPSA